MLLPSVQPVQSVHEMELFVTQLNQTGSVRIRIDLHCKSDEPEAKAGVYESGSCDSPSKR